MKIKFVWLKKDGLQLREALSEDVVQEYSEAMRNGAVFPPVTVFSRDNREFFLADGFHRVEAALRAGLDEIEAEVRVGGYYDAEAFACGANSVTPRSNETKRRCVLRLWEHRMQHFGKTDPSDREIANLAKLPRSTVKSIIFQLANSGQLKLPGTVTGVDGRTRERKFTPPVRRVVPAVPSRPNPPPTKKGYHTGEDGKQHADGVVLDQFGVEVPERIAPAFTGDALDVIITTVQNARMMLSRAIDSGAAEVAGVPQRALLELTNAYHELKASKPYCVCRICQGNGCEACRNTGFQTQEQYSRNPPEFK